jgi:ubiquinone/menaquinone biosynthesis C-methylase UbiE
MPDAVNWDVEVKSGVNVKASAERLPFADGSFDAVHAVNPRFKALTPEITRVMKPGVLLKISASQSNKYRPRRMSDEELAGMGLELVSFGGTLDGEHEFGAMKREDGGPIDPAKLKTWVYRRR